MIGKEECKVFVEFVVGLFDPVAAACYSSCPASGLGKSDGSVAIG